MIAQPRSVSGFSAKRTITFPSFGFFVWLMVASMRPLTRSSFSTRRSPLSENGSLTRNRRGVPADRPLAEILGRRIPHRHLEAVGHDLELRRRIVFEAHAAGP